jgi:hypothetical protein
VRLDLPSRRDHNDDEDYPRRSRREFDPRRPWSRDEEHLRVLSILYYIFGGLSFLGASVPIVHLLIGIALVIGHAGTHSDAAEGWIVIGIASAVILLGYAFAASVIYTGLCMSRRKRYVFCFVTACFCCGLILLLPIGVLGVVLGIFTLIVLARPAVRELFNRDPTAPPPEEAPNPGSLALAISMESRSAITEDQRQIGRSHLDVQRQGDDLRQYRGAQAVDPMRTLSNFYRIGACVLAVLGTLAIVLVVIGIWGLVATAGRGRTDEGLVILTSVGGAYALEGWIGVLFLFGVGRNLAQRRQYWSCFVLGCLFCLLLPMLGIPTIVLLTRPGVKTTFAPSRKGWPLSIF